MGVGEIEVHGKRNAPSRRYTSDSSVKHIVHVNVLLGDRLKTCQVLQNSYTSGDGDISPFLAFR